MVEVRWNRTYLGDDDIDLLNWEFNVFELSLE